MRVELRYLPAVLCGGETWSVILRGGLWAKGGGALGEEGMFGSEGEWGAEGESVCDIHHTTSHHTTSHHTTSHHTSHHVTYCIT